MNYENEINEILLSIKPNEYEPLNIIKERRDSIVLSLFQKFIKYQNNETNLKESLEILEEYEYIEDITELKKGDTIRYFNIKAFYDLKLCNNVTIIDTSKNSEKFVVRNGMYINTIKKNNYFFKKIPKNTLVKMKLMELIQD